VPPDFNFISDYVISDSIENLNNSTTQHELAPTSVHIVDRTSYSISEKDYQGNEEIKTAERSTTSVNSTIPSVSKSENQHPEDYTPYHSQGDRSQDEVTGKHKPEIVQEKFAKLSEVLFLSTKQITEHKAEIVRLEAHTNRLTHRLEELRRLKSDASLQNFRDQNYMHFRACKNDLPT
jgi:chromosome segregation ATPase